MTTRSRRLIGTCLVAALLAMTSQASAKWEAAGAGNAYTKARLMPIGNTPGANATGRNVGVSWTQVTGPDGTPVNGYLVRRYDASTGIEQSVGAGCSGAIATLSCTENAVPPGTWRYTVAPLHAAWTGAESSPSAPVTVGSPVLTLSPPTSATTLPATMVGTLSNFVTGGTVTYRLDDPASGPLLVGTTTPGVIPTSGSATVSVTIPKGTTNGAHTVYAVGNQGDVASAPINVNVTPPAPTTLLLSNNGAPGGAGRPGQGDTLVVTYSQQLDVASICSTWSGDSTNQSVTGDNVVAVSLTNDAAASGNDLLTVSTTGAACGGQLQFGTVDLGSPDFVTGTTTFSGTGSDQSTVAYDATTFQLIVTLGLRSSGANPAKINSSLTATYTPDPAIRNPSWTPIVGTASSTAVQF